MQLIVTIFLLIIITVNSLEDEKKVEVLEYENNSDGKGNYQFRYKTSDGVTRSEVGEFVNGHLKVTGEVYYTTSEGKEEKVSYIADKRGYHFQTTELSSHDQKLKNSESVKDSPQPGLLAALLGGGK